jgi:hypothetical protein
VTSRIGVAISTTGHEHRLELLARSIASWRAALTENGTSEGATVFVTIDGSEEDARRVVDAVGYEPVQFYRVGQPVDIYAAAFTRQGVAANKNTGLELLMDAGVDHLFLSDDDTWPLYRKSLDKHTGFGQPHSMVCWGKHRLEPGGMLYDAVYWSWPRGVMLYQHRSVVETVGGMIEAFGPGGHEHAEYSQRIHNAGLTAAPFISPASYGTREAAGAAALWHCEDMRRPGERAWQHKRRRDALTSVTTTSEDWARIDKVMARQAGSTAFVPYSAAENGRASATLCSAPSRGAGAGEGDEK